jgi:hypothetical protein
MSFKPNLSRAVLFLAFMPFPAFGQEEEPKRKVRLYERAFQLSLYPGISTNGIASGSYINKYSLNLFGGLNASNRNLEIGLLTNSHFQSSSGLQFAGLANITGTNAFVNLTQSEERALIHDGFEVNNRGVQVAGFLNYVLNHTTGAQISGGFNHTGNDFKGVQIAGIGNSAGGFSTGVHFAGFYNLAKKSVTGVQVSGLFNYTDEYLSGTQIALINKARKMLGTNSTPYTKARSLQIGLFNSSKEGHGTQIGLINFGGDMRGKQIGLINFYQKMKSKEFANAGTPIGILNFGSFGSIPRIHLNEIFAVNMEYVTGNCRNCTWTAAGPIGPPYIENNKKLNQNALTLGYDPIEKIWGFGWGFQKVLLNKFSSKPNHPLNEVRQMTYGIRFLHLNREWMKVDRKFNLVSRVYFEWGRKGIKPIKSIYKYVGLSLNYFLYDAVDGVPNFTIRSKTFDLGTVGNYNAMFWPGYSAGVML